MSDPISITVRIGEHYANALCSTDYMELESEEFIRRVIQPMVAVLLDSQVGPTGKTRLQERIDAAVRISGLTDT